MRRFWYGPGDGKVVLPCDATDVHGTEFAAVWNAAHIASRAAPPGVGQGMSSLSRRPGSVVFPAERIESSSVPVIKAAGTKDHLSLRDFPYSRFHLQPSLRKRQDYVSFQERRAMKIILRQRAEEGKIGWLFLWLIGIPVPILLLLFLLRGCT